VKSILPIGPTPSAIESENFFVSSVESTVNLDRICMWTIANMVAIAQGTGACGGSSFLFFHVFKTPHMMI
jgi:hypothetical protein